jgi:LmbE family N-acetylglucosaminyl deacetylase
MSGPAAEGARTLGALARELFAAAGGDGGGGAARWLVVAAHPDDETVGASWILARGPEVFVLHVTDGAPRDPRLWPAGARGTREDYARLRHEELAAALSLAGVGRDRAHALGVVDQDASSALACLACAVSLWIERLCPDVVVAHPYEGGHPDHDAAAFAVHAAARLLERRGRRPPRILEMTSYHRAGGRLRTGAFLPGPAPIAERPLASAERELKRRMLRCFGSQAPVLSAFQVDTERFRAAPRYDFGRPPHPGALHYESLGWAPDGGEWRRRARRAERELGLEGGSPCP